MLKLCSVFSVLFRNTKNSEQQATDCFLKFRKFFPLIKEILHLSRNEHHLRANFGRLMTHL